MADDQKFGSMKDFTTDEQMKQESAQLRASLIAGRQHNGRYQVAHAVFADNVLEGRLFGDGDTLILEVIGEGDGRYSVVLENGFHTFYLSHPDKTSGEKTKVIFSTPEEIVTEFPGLTWR